MAAKARLGAGNVEIELDGEPIVLKPTLKAAQTLSRQADGLLGAVQRVSRFDLDTITQVIALGSGQKVTEVADAVWRTGVTELAEPVIRYISVLSNGGRPVDESGGGEGDADPQT